MPATDAGASSGGRSSKAQKRSKMVTLKLSSALLSKFPGTPAAAVVKSEDKSKASSPSSNAPAAAPTNASPDNASDSASTPAANGGSTPAPAAEPTRRRGVPGPKPGRKRGLGDGVDAAPKPRGKPGPKKKPRLEDGTIDTSARPAGPVASHKLGPKANQGAINAGLRALDRTGKPCRKWERKSFNLKSFTGVIWQVPSWSAPPKPKLAEDSDSKANNSTSVVESEKSNSGEADTTPLPTNVESSPAPVVAAVS